VNFFFFGFLGNLFVFKFPQLPIPSSPPSNSHKLKIRTMAPLNHQKQHLNYKHKNFHIFPLFGIQTVSISCHYECLIRNVKSSKKKLFWCHPNPIKIPRRKIYFKNRENARRKPGNLTIFSLQCSILVLFVLCSGALSFDREFFFFGKFSGFLDRWKMSLEIYETGEIN
jgi:hypothetical protein